MKRLTAVLAAFAIVVTAAVAFAANQHEHATVHADHSTMGGAMAAGKPGTWKGEVLDAGCYLGHGAMGAKHKECALKCASNGMPLMLMVDGKAVLLTPNHDNADPYNALKTMAGSVAEVSGTLYSRGGASGIDVTGAKLVAAK
jgi:hypothetical protein